MRAGLPGALAPVLTLCEHSMTAKFVAVPCYSGDGWEPCDTTSPCQTQLIQQPYSIIVECSAVHKSTTHKQTTKLSTTVKPGGRESPATSAAVANCRL